MTIRTNCYTDVVGSYIDLLFEDSAAVLCWCVGQSKPIITETTDLNGQADFLIFGGGCYPNDFPTSTSVRVVIDGITFARMGVNSPDVVDDFGVMAQDGWNPGGTCIVKGNDGVWHTPAIVSNLVEPCSKFDQGSSVDDPINSADAVILTPFIVANASCGSQ